jgi:FixJ family two-component response regulator
MKSAPDAREDIAPIVYVVDDDQAVRTSLQWLLESVGYKVRTYANGREFLAGYDPDLPGCVLLDVRMPSMGGFEVQEALQAGGRAPTTIFLTAHGDIPMTVRALKGGAFDFVEKPFNDQNLLDKVQAAIAFGAQVSSERAASRKARQRLDVLSPRERVVLEKLAEGKSSKLIAKELDISYKTVEVHRAHIREKLGASSLAELVRLALDSGKQPT